MVEKTIKLTGQQLVQAIENEKSKLEMLNRRMGSLQAISREIAGAELAIKEIGKTKPDEKILVSLGAGLFMDATIQENSKVLMGMTGDVLKYKTIEEAKKELEIRRNDLNKEIREVQEESRRTASNLNNLNKALALAVKKQRAG